MGGSGSSGSGTQPFSLRTRAASGVKKREKKANAQDQPSSSLTDSCGWSRQSKAVSSCLMIR